MMNTKSPSDFIIELVIIVMGIQFISFLGYRAWFRPDKLKDLHNELKRLHPPLDVPTTKSNWKYHLWSIRIFSLITFPLLLLIAIGILVSAIKGFLK